MIGIGFLSFILSLDQCALKQGLWERMEYLYVPVGWKKKEWKRITAHPRKMWTSKAYTMASKSTNGPF